MRHFVLVALLAVASLAAQAQSPVDPLSRCLADNTSGRERKELARWVFFAIAAHPEIKQYAVATVSQATDEANRALAKTVTRLLTESCLKQTQDAMKQGGTRAIQIAFQALGQLAMQEIMSSADVMAAMSSFEKHLDQSKFNDAFGKK